jgi:hypothetical protein
VTVGLGQHVVATSLNYFGGAVSGIPCGTNLVCPCDVCGYLSTASFEDLESYLTLLELGTD